jgi:uncharacterized protein
MASWRASAPCIAFGWRSQSRVLPNLISSALLETELRRLAVRIELEQSMVTEVLARVDLVDPPRSLFHEAGLLPGAHLRSVDALHLATALRVDSDIFLAYDTRFLAAARSVASQSTRPPDCRAPTSRRSGTLCWH